MTGNRILLLGGGGFVGRALTSLLLENRYEVHWIEPATEEPQRPVQDRVALHRGDLGDRTLLKEVLAKCETVVHLASNTTPGTSAKKPSIEAEANISPTLKLLDTIHEYPDLHLIFISSGGTLYGNQNRTPVSEMGECTPLSYHGAGKAAIEMFFRTLARTYDRRVTILRPSNLYGPGQPFRLGFGLIRTMLESLYEKNTVNIWGDGEAVRDYCYIDDLIWACLLLIEQEQAGIYNVGSGEGYSINDIRRVIELVTGKKMDVQYNPRRAIDVETIILDSTKLYKKTGWQSEVDIEEGIQRTWDWLKAEKQAYR